MTTITTNLGQIEAQKEAKRSKIRKEKIDNLRKGTAKIGTKALGGAKAAFSIAAPIVAGFAISYVAKTAVYGAVAAVGFSGVLPALVGFAFAGAIAGAVTSLALEGGVKKKRGKDLKNAMLKGAGLGAVGGIFGGLVQEGLISEFWNNIFGSEAAAQPATPEISTSNPEASPEANPSTPSLISGFDSVKIAPGDTLSELLADNDINVYDGSFYDPALGAKSIDVVWAALAEANSNMGSGITMNGDMIIAGDTLALPTDKATLVELVRDYVERNPNVTANYPAFKL